VTDDSRLHQWVLFEKELFEKHPVRNPTAGTAKSVTSFSRKQLVDYYTTHYLPNNMIISVIGNVGSVKKKVENYFGALKPGKLTKRPKVSEPLQKRIKKFVLRKRNLNSYMVLGYKTVPRTNKESYVFDVIAAVLGRGQSGWMFDEIRNKRGLAYQVGINNEQESDYGFFAVYSGLDKSKIEKAQELIMQQIERLQNISKKDFDEAKSYIEGNHTLTMEDNFHKADNMAVWECIKDAKLTKSYLKSIKNVTVSDLKKTAKKYLNGKYTLVVIEQK
jgi:zinc protease